MGKSSCCNYTFWALLGGNGVVNLQDEKKKTPIEGAHQKKIPPTIPTIVIENMTSIFAQSGKMTIQQACEPDEFTVPAMK